MSESLYEFVPPKLRDVPPLEADGLRYRRATSSDVHGVLALWDLAGWGPLPHALFRRRWLEGPAGSALIVVIEDESGDIVGSSITDFKAGILLGEPTLVRRGHALVLAPHLRRRARGQGEVKETDPAQRMSQLRKQYLEGAGLGAGFSVPNPSLLNRPRLGKGERRERSFAGLKITIADLPEHSPQLEVLPVPFFHSEYDRLWERAYRNLGLECALLRTATWMNHLRDRDSLKLECRSSNTGALVGYASLQFAGIWKLNDILGEDEEALAAVAQSVAMWFRSKVGQDDVRDADRPGFGLSIIDHPRYGPHFRMLGAYETDWEFRLRLSPGEDGSPLGPAQEPDRWFFTMGD